MNERFYQKKFYYDSSLKLKMGKNIPESLYGYLSIINQKRRSFGR